LCIAVAALLAYLALTKVIFGYVLVVAAAVSIIWLVTLRGQEARRSLVICLLALVFCTPYLFYTYKLTGKVFYWSNAGGMQLYWMSSPYPGDLGDWKSSADVVANPLLAVNHAAFFEEVSNMDSIKADDTFKAAALSNIQHQHSRVDSKLVQESSGQS